jgi:glycosyltransferase involved in cell wall biosynthesis
LVKKSDAIVAISPLQKMDLCEKYRIAPEEKVHVIPLGFDLSKFNSDKAIKRERWRKKFGIEAEHLVISIVGRLAPVKNHALYVRIMKDVMREYPEVRAVIVGDGEQRQSIEAMIGPGSFGKDARSPFVFTSWQREMDDVMAGSDIVLMTSLNEGTPVTLIEAQASGKPVVSTRVGGVANCILPDESGFIAEISDEEELKLSLHKLIRSEQLRNKMGHAGFEFVQNKFSYTRLVNDMKTLYNGLLNQKGL